MIAECIWVLNICRIMAMLQLLSVRLISRSSYLADPLYCGSAERPYGDSSSSSTSSSSTSPNRSSSYDIKYHSHAPKE